MTIEELREGLLKILNRTGQDEEVDHADADDLLLEYINDREVTDTYEAIDKWYA